MAEVLSELTGGRGPDACIDAVGLEAHSHGGMYAYDRAKQMLMRWLLRCSANFDGDGAVIAGGALALDS